MTKPDNTIIKETKYIAIMIFIFSIIMELVFLILSKWDITVLYGNLLGALAMILNFYFMGIGVQKALGKDEKDAQKILKGSLSLRTFFLFVTVALGAWLKCFSTIAVIIPMFFPRIAVAMRPLWKSKNEGGMNS
ncbi:MAG: hypothetical protein E7394_08325 [Ruminococcaceae bacterium]|nr:hypothetical protein [Oscillospiraceae bacterium]